MRHVRAGKLSMWKGASFADAARNAVFSALLAQGGMSGPAPIFEGEMGFFKQVSGPFELKTSSFGGRGGTFKLPETYIKYYPAEYHSQTAISAALELRKQIEDPSLVESVEVATHEAGFTILAKDRGKWRPSTKETADHSLPYIVGMALLEGKVDNATYSPKKMENERVLEFLQKITVAEDKALTALYPEKGMPNRITVRLRSGKTFAEEVLLPKGHPLNPLTDSEVEEKFRKLTRSFLSVRGSDRILDRLWRLEKLVEIGEIFAELKVT